MPLCDITLYVIYREYSDLEVTGECSSLRLYISLMKTWWGHVKHSNIYLTRYANFVVKESNEVIGNLN